MRIRTPGGGIVHRRETHLGTEVDASELLEQLRRATLLDRRGPVHHEVLAQAGRTDLAALEGHRHPWVAADVVQLALMRVEVSGEQIVAVDRHPDAGHLRSPPFPDGDEVAERSGTDQLLGAGGEGHTGGGV